MELRPRPFEPWAELAVHNGQVEEGQYGASDCFIGWMRDHNDGDRVTNMFIEHYPGMSERELERLANEIGERRDLCELLLIHRVGEILVGEAIVVVAAYAAHRREAFVACREIMEQLKSYAPFWKKERLAEGDRWVERNSPGE